MRIPFCLDYEDFKFVQNICSTHTEKKMVRDLQFYSNMLLQSETAGTVYKKYGT